MTKLFSKKVAAICLSLSIASLLAMPTLVGALNSDIKGGLEEGSEFRDVNLGTKDIKGTVAQIINIVLGVLGIVAVVIILAGGFKWMTAGGNEDKVGESKKMIIQGIIGLVIVFAAWGIASFVIKSLSDASRTGSSTTTTTSSGNSSSSNIGTCSNAPSERCEVDTDCRFNSNADGSLPSGMTALIGYCQ